MDQREMVGAEKAASRRTFLRRSATAATAAGAAATALGMGSRAEAALVKTPAAREHFQEIQTHENSHVTVLLQVLGGAGYPAPQFVNITAANYSQFVSLSATFENAGVKAYLGAAGVIQNTNILGFAASIALIEARHAGWLNSLIGAPLSEENDSFQTSLTPVQIAQAVAPFFADQSIPLQLANAISTTPSGTNDGNILRFALGLEYLERDYYNINVPRFFR